MVSGAVSEEDLRRRHKGNVEELQRMLSEVRDMHKKVALGELRSIHRRILESTRRDMRHQLNFHVIIHPELEYLERLRERAAYRSVSEAKGFFDRLTGHLRRRKI